MRPSVIIKMYEDVYIFTGIYDYVRYVHHAAFRQRVGSTGILIWKALVFRSEGWRRKA